MNQNTKPFKLSYYGLYLLSYLREHHPDKADNATFVEERADRAAEAFEQARREGYLPEGAQELAMSALLEGLRFSKYDTIIEVLWNEFPDEIAVMTKPLSQAADQPEDVIIYFEKGIPKKVNGEELSPAALMRKLNAIGKEHAVGRVDIVENRFVGMKSRGVYETPGGTILNLAHRGLEEITMDREVMHLRDSLIPRYADMVYNGFWYAPEREMLQAAITESQKFVTGEVRVKLYKGACHVTGRRSEYSLYDDHVASFEDNRAYNHKDAEGFIRLNALRLRVLANSKQKRY